MRWFRGRKAMKRLIGLIVIPMVVFHARSTRAIQKHGSTPFLAHVSANRLQGISTVF